MSGSPLQANGAGSTASLVRGETDVKLAPADQF